MYYASNFTKNDAYLRQNYEVFAVQPRKIKKNFNFTPQNYCFSAYFCTLFFFLSVFFAYSAILCS